VAGAKSGLIEILKARENEPSQDSRVDVKPVQFAEEKLTCCNISFANRN
jgi:hypothetical protein